MPEEDDVEFIILEPTEADEFQPPSYGKPGIILVKVMTPLYEKEHSWQSDWEYEILDADEDSGVFWINEGTGYDWWLDAHCQFKSPGTYLIKNVVGYYYRGTWGFDDDDESWVFDEPILVSDNIEILKDLEGKE